MIPIISRSVVIAESSPLAARRIASAFSDLGFVIHTVAEDGISALRSARENPPGIVTLDMVLPRLSGLQLATSLPDTTIIIAISAVTARARIAQAKAAGVSFYLLKPVADEQLRLLISRNWPEQRVASLAR